MSFLNNILSRTNNLVSRKKKMLENILSGTNCYIKSKKKIIPKKLV